MRTLLLLLAGYLAFHSIASQASSCSHNKTSLGAHYKISKQYPGKKAKYTELHLWRQGQKVAHQYPQTDITEYWQLTPNDRIEVVRYFDHHQRAIEYQAGETVHGRGEKDWSYRYQLISQRLLGKMQRISQSGSGCDEQWQLTLDSKKGHLTLIWLPQLQLVKHFELRKNNGFTETWQLADLNLQTAQVNDFFAKRATYQSTDFADIGDDHSDPFLTNMVNLGFIEHGASGFYDDQGNALAGEHHHH